MNGALAHRHGTPQANETFDDSNDQYHPTPHHFTRNTNELCRRQPYTTQ